MTLNVELMIVSDVYEKGSGTGDSSGRRIQRSDVKPARTVFLSEEDVRLMQSFRDEFDRIGGLHVYVCLLGFFFSAFVFSVLVCYCWEFLPWEISHFLRETSSIIRC